MSSHEEQLVELLDEFSEILANDPGPLSPDDKRYVEHLHGAGAEDVVLSLKRQCERVRGSSMFYFTGQRGTGKSTELRRLARLLEEKPGTRAFIVDTLDYISDSHPIQLNDLLLVMALAFADRLRDLSISLNRLGSVAQAQGRLDVAAQAYEEGLDLRRRLLRDYGNTLQGCAT